MKYNINKIKTTEEENYINVLHAYVEADSYAEFKKVAAEKYGYKPFGLFSFYAWHNFTMEHPKITNFFSNNPFFWLTASFTVSFALVLGVAVLDMTFCDWMITLGIIFFGFNVILNTIIAFGERKADVKIDQEFWDENHSHTIVYHPAKNAK